MEISFSYIITFISLIYGLALAHSLSCIAGYIQHWKEIKQYWVWWFWAIFLMLLSVGFWISIYAFYSDIEKWNVSHIFILTFQSSLFYLTYYIFFNHFHELENNDLEVEFYKYKKPYFILLAIQLLLMFLGNDVLISDKNIVVIFQQNIPILFFTILFILLGYINNKIVHKIFAVFFVIKFVSDIIWG